LFVGMPLVAMAVRRRHPGWTLVLLLPSILVYISPLMWGEASWWLLLPLIGIATLIGAVANLARQSAAVELDTPAAAGG
jgi:predicted membrane metal-binding protein